MTGVSQQMQPSSMWRVDLGLGVRASAVLGGLVVIGLALTLLIVWGCAKGPVCSPPKIRWVYCS